MARPSPSAQDGDGHGGDCPGESECGFFEEAVDCQRGGGLRAAGVFFIGLTGAPDAADRDGHDEGDHGDGGHQPLRHAGSRGRGPGVGEHMDEGDHQQRTGSPRTTRGAVCRGDALTTLQRGS